MTPPDNDPYEATFRWTLYKTFGRMMEIGARGSVAGRPGRVPPADWARWRSTAAPTPRPSSMPSGPRPMPGSPNPCPRRPWIASYDFESLGPSGLEEIKWIWGREAAMWGAYLDDDDRRALKRRPRQSARANRADPPSSPRRR